MPGSDEDAPPEGEATVSIPVSEELAAELGAEETVTLPVDDALAAELGAEELAAEATQSGISVEAVLPDAREPASFARAPALPETALVAYTPRRRYEEVTSRLLATDELLADADAASIEEAAPIEHVPAPHAQEAARPAATRPSLGRLAARAVIGLAMALGVFVIGHHLVTADDRPAAGPLRVVQRATGDAVRDDVQGALTPDPADATRPLPELERAAAAHLAAGRLSAAGRVYVTLALRAPHEPAYAVAARVLGGEPPR